jgi:hypothetical protein
VPRRVDFPDCHLSIFEIKKDPIGVPEQTVGSLRRTHFPKRMKSGPPNFFHCLDLLAGLREKHFHHASVYLHSCRLLEKQEARGGE